MKLDYITAESIEIAEKKAGLDSESPEIGKKRESGNYSVLEKLIMQFMSHSPVWCPSATSLRLIRS
jgi:hypothetical protein